MAQVSCHTKLISHDKRRHWIDKKHDTSKIRRYYSLNSYLLPPPKTNTTMKIHHLKIYFPLKVRIFQGHVSFQRCSPNGKPPPKQASMHYSSPQNRPNVSQSLDCVFGGFRMSNKNCTPYIFWMPIKKKTPPKQKPYTTKGGSTTDHWIILFLLFWLGASSQVPGGLKF